MNLSHAQRRNQSSYRYTHRNDSDAILEELINFASESENMKGISPVKVLIVEDTEICQKIALYMLSKPDYLAEVVATGKEALEKYPQGYDVLLLDLGLPDMSGLDVCRHIRKKIGDVTTPIIAYSANSDSFHEECVEAGFSQVLLKPTKREILDQVIKKLVNKD